AELDLVVCLNPMSSRPEDLLASGRGRVRGAVRRSVGRRLGWEARRLRERGTAVVLLQPGPDDLAVLGANLMSTARRHLVLETAVRTTTARLADGELAGLLQDQPRAPEHRVRRPEGPVGTWPAEALPPGTSVAPAAVTGG
ncbi:MAG TPA: hypothetical protein VNU66_01125, partial [Mycobacteriales bacterium]|nr:hypothetical protein [Mycobacteriales bacterium]